MSPPFVSQFAPGTALRSAGVNAGAGVIAAAAAMVTVVFCCAAVADFDAVRFSSSSESAPVLAANGSVAADAEPAASRLSAQQTRINLNLMCPSCGAGRRGVDLASSPFTASKYSPPAARMQPERNYRACRQRSDEVTVVRSPELRDEQPSDHRSDPATSRSRRSRHRAASRTSPRPRQSCGGSKPLSP